MKIVYVMRPQKANRHSIETVFGNIIPHLPGQIETLTYVCPGSESIFQTWRELRRLNADLYHITGDVNFHAIGLLGRKVVLTVHDLGHFKNLKGYKKFLYGLFWFRIPGLIARKITCISDFTLRDLCQHFPSLASKSIAIPNPVSPKLQPSPWLRHNPPHILQVGTGIHKNLGTVIKALEGLNCRLIIVGNLSGEQIAALHAKNIEYESRSNLTESEIIEQYINCDLVTFVSLHEGFGMPLIEAQALGRPVVTSKCGALAKVNQGSAPDLDDPMDHVSLKKMIMRLLEDEEYRNFHLNAGYKNIERFSGDAVVSQYCAIYQVLLN
jgi:glycosyltransferase involved in cell wall biosynthesis